MQNFYISAELVGSNVLLRGYEGGERVQLRVHVKPSLYVKSNKASGEYKSIYGDRVERIDFETPREARDFIEQYKDVGGFEIHGMQQFLYPFLNERYPSTIDYDASKIKTHFLDIEVDSKDGFGDIKTANREITAITIYCDGGYTTWGLKEYSTGIVQNSSYRGFATERGLLVDFLAWWGVNIPDVLTGWNIEGFDIPYLVRRITNVLGETECKKLSPWGMIRTKEVKNKFGEFDTFYIVGVSILDYMSLYKKFTYTKQESYSLDFISQTELGVGKLDYSEYGSLAGLYEHNHQKFIDYNIIDVKRVVDLDGKLGLLDLIYAIAYDAKVEFVDALGTVTLWDALIHNYLIEQKIVVPRKIDGYGGEVPGAFVKEPVPGYYKWVVSFDLTSLYPHLIMMLNLGPETIAEYFQIDADADVIGMSDSFRQLSERAKKHNLALAGNGAMFTKELESFLSVLMGKMFLDRNRAKKEMLALKSKKQEFIDEIQKRGLSARC